VSMNDGSGSPTTMSSDWKACVVESCYDSLELGHPFEVDAGSVEHVAEPNETDAVSASSGLALNDVAWKDEEHQIHHEA
jgi:hypothetical protein